MLCKKSMVYNQISIGIEPQVVHIYNGAGITRLVDGSSFYVQLFVNTNYVLYIVNSASFIKAHKMTKAKEYYQNHDFAGLYRHLNN